MDDLRGVRDRQRLGDLPRDADDASGSPCADSCSVGLDDSIAM
jgi:hypothetical protein